MLSFEQVGVEKMVAYLRDSIRGQDWHAGQDCTHRYEILSSRSVHPIIEHGSVLGSRAAAVIAIKASALTWLMF